MTLQELLDKRAAVFSQLESLNESAVELTEDQAAQFDALKDEIDSIDKAIERHKSLQEFKAASAAPLSDSGSTTPHISVPAPEEESRKGIKFARLVRARLNAKKHETGPAGALDFAKRAYGNSSAVVKTLLGGSGDGANLVPEAFSSEVIELLRDATVIRGSGVREVGMPNGNLTYPRQSGGTAATYVGENATVDANDAAFDQVQLVAKKLVTFTSLSAELAEDNAYGADQLILDDIVESLAQGEDKQLLRGTGSATAPTSLLEIATGAGGVISANATVNLQNVSNDLGKLEQHLLDANVNTMGARYIIAPRTEIFLKNLRDGNGNKAFPEMDGGMLRGYPYSTTNSVPKNLGAGTDESEIYFYQPSEFIIGDARTIDVQITNTGSFQVSGSLVSAFANDLYALRASSRHDFAARHDAGVAVLDTVIWVP